MCALLECVFNIELEFVLNTSTEYVLNEQHPHLDQYGLM